MAKGDKHLLAAEAASENAKIPVALIYATLASAYFTKAGNLQAEERTVGKVSALAAPYAADPDSDTQTPRGKDIGRRVRAIAKTDREQALIGRLDAIATIIQDALADNRLLCFNEVNMILSFAHGDD